MTTWEMEYRISNPTTLLPSNNKNTLNCDSTSQVFKHFKHESGTISWAHLFNLETQQSS